MEGPGSGVGNYPRPFHWLSCWVFFFMLCFRPACLNSYNANATANCAGLQATDCSASSSCALVPTCAPSNGFYAGKQTDTCFVATTGTTTQVSEGSRDAMGQIRPGRVDGCNHLPLNLDLDLDLDLEC